MQYDMDALEGIKNFTEKSNDNLCSADILVNNTGVITISRRDSKWFMLVI